MARRHYSGLLTSMALLTVVGACSEPKVIRNTKIPDTQLNREILNVITEYRRALEKRDIPRILMLVHPSYQDSSGTPEPEDDIDFAKLKQVLSERLAHTSRIRYRIEYQRLTFKGSEAQVDVWIDATFVYQHPRAQPRYRRFTDYHRYRLILADKKKWRFIEGL